MDPRNPVVRLCGEGMRAETEGRADAARELFAQAWEAAEDDYERCVAAHYVARHQPTPEETLRWNQESLDLAGRVADDRVAGLYASLHFNLATSHAELGDPVRARRHLDEAAAHLADVPPGPYLDGIAQAIDERLADAQELSAPAPSGRRRGSRAGPGG